MPITITFKINPIFFVYLDDSPLLQFTCRLGLNSEVISALSILCPYFSHFFCNPIFSFFPKKFCTIFITSFTINILDFFMTLLFKSIIILQ